MAAIEALLAHYQSTFFEHKNDGVVCLQLIRRLISQSYFLSTLGQKRSFYTGNALFEHDLQSTLEPTFLTNEVFQCLHKQVNLEVNRENL